MIPIYLMNFFFAISTTIGMTIIPLLITDGLGLSLLVLGIIEGSAEFISNLLRLITGNIFDRIKNKKLLFIVPSAIALFSKLVLCFPSSITILTSKLTERIANGAFAAPRDAYVGENTKNKGLALGFLSFSKTSGCVVGPLTISAITIYFGSLKDNMFWAILLACLVNLVSFLLALFVDTKKTIILNFKNEFNFTEFSETLKNLRFIFIISFLFFLGRFNDGVIMLYLKSQNFPEWFYLGTISFFNILMLLISPLLGLATDKKRDKQVLFVTIIALLLFNILFFNVVHGSWILAILGLVCWGMQRAGAQITFSAMIFKNAPTKFYGTAIGVYSIISGLGVFIASGISGYLAEHISFASVFLLSGAASLLSLLFAAFMMSSKLKSQKDKNIIQKI